MAGLMKRTYFLLPLLAVLACNSLHADTMIVTMKDGRQVRYDLDQVADVRFESDSPGRGEHSRMGNPPPQTRGNHERFRGEVPFRRDAWEVVSGNWDFGGEIACRTSGGKDDTTFRALFRGAQMQNGTITARVRIGQGQYNDVGLLFRMQDDDNGYGVRLQKDGFLSLRRIVDGRGDHIKSVSTPVGPGPHDIRVELNESRIMVYLDGRLLIDRTDNRFPSEGRVGVLQDRGSDGSILSLRVEED